LAKCYQVKDTKDNLTNIIGTAIDTTEIIQERHLTNIYQQLATILESEKNLNEVTPKLLKLICEAMEWEVAEIWLLDNEKQVLRCIGSWYEPTIAFEKFQYISQKHTFLLGECLPGRVWRDKKVITILDFASSSEYSRSSAAQIAGLNSAVGVPIMYKKGVVGVLDFFSVKHMKMDNDSNTFMSNISKSIGKFIKRKYSEDQLIHLSRHDFLTDLLNRSAFEEEVNGLIEDIKFQRLAIIIFDVSRFKLINESVGHKSIDLLLKLVASRIKATINYDKSNIARLNADTFIIYYYRFKLVEEVKSYAHELELAFREPFLVGKEKVILFLNIGVALYPQHGSDAKSLMHNANLALSQAKDSDNNKIEFFTKELPDIATKKMVMDIDLKHALIENQFILYFQPQVALKTEHICGAEALIRWLHPTKGLISPFDFLPFAEENDLIISVNEHVLYMVFKMVGGDWSGPTISVNISAKQFGNNFHFVEYIEDLIREFKVNPKNIEFEITEGFLMRDVQHNLAILASLNKLGFNFSIDDFGTGFSSFNYLHRMLAAKIKIDMSFIQGLPTNNTNALIVKSIISLFHSLNMKVVAEGAETEDEINFLKQENCDIVQGYYYYKPMPVDKFMLLLKGDISDIGG
jgi:diguanylate cyclase (GGDEF)-like protein